MMAYRAPWQGSAWPTRYQPGSYGEDCQRYAPLALPNISSNHTVRDEDDDKVDDDDDDDDVRWREQEEEMCARYRERRGEAVSWMGIDSMRGLRVVGG